MRIALRTSGGRGEYEVAGSQGDVHVTDVYDHAILLELLPGRRIAINNVIRHVQGKPRIRLREQAIDRHAYLVLADILLLPKPKREIGITPAGKLQIRDNAYSIVSIQFDIVAIDHTTITIRPTDLVLSNSGGDLARVDVIERMRILLNLWSHSRGKDDRLSRMVQQHQDSFDELNVSQIKQTASSLRNAVEKEDDPLRQVLRLSGLSGPDTFWLGIHQNDVESAILEEDPTEPSEAARKRVKIWRLQAARGADAARFSQEIKQIYRNTCLFTGYFLPKTHFTGSAGVDSAHILPWAEYELNSNNNGLCLSKLCHWAFDSGILVLDFDKQKHEYVLEVSSQARRAEYDGLIDLSAFDNIEGPIPRTRLPVQESDWPNPDFLVKYNEVMTNI